jgi:hypothetical protein
MSLETALESGTPEAATMNESAERLERIEKMLAELLEREMVKEYYPTDEFARLVGKAEFTVREWARLGRIKAEKRQSGRGAYAAWVVSHPDLLRYQQHGLMPLPVAPTPT